MNLNNLSGGIRERLLRRRLLAAGVSPSSATASVCSFSDDKNNNTSTHVKSTPTSSSSSNVSKTNKQPLLKEKIIANAAKRRLSEGKGRKENKPSLPRTSLYALDTSEPPTLLQRRRMEPLSPITFNSPSNNGRVMVGKTYIKPKKQQQGKTKSVVSSKHTSVHKSSSSKSVVSKKYSASDRLSKTPTVVASDEGRLVPPKLNKTPLGVKVASLRKLHRPLRHVKSPQDGIEGKNEVVTRSPETLKQNRPSSRAALSKMMQLENENKRITNARASAEKKSVPKKQVANTIETPYREESAKKSLIENKKNRIKDARVLAKNSLSKQADDTNGTPPKQTAPSEPKEGRSELGTPLYCPKRSPAVQKLVSKYGSSVGADIKLTIEDNSKDPSKCKTDDSGSSKQTYNSRERYAAAKELKRLRQMSRSASPHKRVSERNTEEVTKKGVENKDMQVPKQHRGRSTTRASDNMSSKPLPKSGASTSPLPPKAMARGKLKVLRKYRSASAPRKLHSTDGNNTQKKNDIDALQTAMLALTTVSASLDNKQQKTVVVADSLQTASSLESISNDGGYLGVTQSCSFTNNTSTMDERSVQSQTRMRRKRAREVLAGSGRYNMKR